MHLLIVSCKMSSMSSKDSYMYDYCYTSFIDIVSRNYFLVKVSHFFGSPSFFLSKLSFCGFQFVIFFCRFQRGLKRKPMALIKKLRKAVSN